MYICVYIYQVIDLSIYHWSICWNSKVSTKRIDCLCNQFTRWKPKGEPISSRRLLWLTQCWILYNQFPWSCAMRNYLHVEIVLMYPSLVGPPYSTRDEVPIGCVKRRFCPIISSKQCTHTLDKYLTVIRESMDTNQSDCFQLRNNFMIWGAYEGAWIS